MQARVALGVGKGVLFREVSSVQFRSVLTERERFYTHAHCSNQGSRVEGFHRKTLN